MRARPKDTRLPAGLGRRKHQIRPGLGRAHARERSCLGEGVWVEKQERAAAGVDKQRVCPSNVSVGGGISIDETCHRRPIRPLS